MLRCRLVKRIPSLDGLWAISISLVLAGHLTKAGPVPKFMANYAGTGARIFFVISGYLITTILLNEHSQTSTINLRPVLYTPCLSNPARRSSVHAVCQADVLARPSLV
jgi:peptidoglycan/LPS O-acetylase OafA/YrhL